MILRNFFLEHVPYNVLRPLYLIAAKARPQKKARRLHVTLPVTAFFKDILDLDVFGNSGNTEWPRTCAHVTLCDLQCLLRVAEITQPKFFTSKLPKGVKG